MAPHIPARIRALAICVFRHGDRILVGESYDPTRRQTFYRPLGGGIDFGERGRDTILREAREELGAEVTDVRYLGTIENIFTYDGKPGHEVVLVHDARFVDPTLYQRAWLDVYEREADAHERAYWKSIDELRRGPNPVYPDGLLDFLAPLPYTDLPPYQARVAELVAAHDLKASAEARLLDLVSEVGEVAREALKATRYGHAPFDTTPAWSDEMADVFFSLVCLANTTNVDLERALDGALAKYRARLGGQGDAGSGR